MSTMYYKHQGNWKEGSIQVELTPPYTPCDKWILRRNRQSNLFENIYTNNREVLKMGNSNNKTNTDLDYKVVELSQEEYDKLGGYVWSAIDKDGCKDYFKTRPEKELSSDWWCVPRSSISLALRNWVSPPTNWKNTLTKYVLKDPSKFTKDMLKDGMVVRLRKGTPQLVIDGKISSMDAWGPLENYALLLEHNHYPHLDIMEVYTTTKGALQNMLDPQFLTSIWVRKEKTEQELKIEEIEATMESQKEALASSVKALEELKKSCNK